MVHNLVLTGRYDIGIKNEKFMLDDVKADIKDVSFIRYRFEKYGEDEINYIGEMHKKFPYSTHLAEVYLYPGCTEDIVKLNNTFDDVAVFIYVTINDEDVASNNISDYYRELLEEATAEDGMIFERIMIKDESKSLFTIAANKIKDVIKEIACVESDCIGICSSPLSMYDNNACLTAVTARDIASRYNECGECALPSANHQFKNSNCCGCIKHVIIDKDIEAPVDTGKKKAKASNTDKKHKEKDDAEKSKDKPVKKLKGKFMRGISNW